MKKTIIIIIIALIIISTALTITIFQANLTGKTISETHYYTYTKAICDKNNICQDYKITCNNSQVIESTPLTGAIIQNPEIWNDPRNNQELCG